MQVKFKTSGRWAHEKVAQGQFDFDVDSVIDGISERDAAQIEKLGYGTILGVDSSEDVDEDEHEDDDKDENKKTNNFPSSE